MRVLTCVMSMLVTYIHPPELIFSVIVNKHSQMPVILV